jgi:hypothetical protein
VSCFSPMSHPWFHKDGNSFIHTPLATHPAVQDCSSLIAFTSYAGSLHTTKSGSLHTTKSGSLHNSKSMEGVHLMPELAQLASLRALETGHLSSNSHLSSASPRHHSLSNTQVCPSATPGSPFPLSYAVYSGGLWLCHTGEFR